ncbi:MAG: 3-phosphoshikimate 1-carboxyvinyltransferase [Candidatus Micrarchaeota archaeon]
MRFIKPAAVSGRLDAPPSKSMMQRAVIAAALADGESVLSNPSFCDDALAAMKVVEVLGAKAEREERLVRVKGSGGPDAGGGLPDAGGRVLDCGESGTCMRMISAVAALFGKEFTITGRGSLMNRPVGMIENPLRTLGAECRTQNGKPPIVVRGPIHGGRVEADGSESSQFVSGLLMALPLCKENSELNVLKLKSGGYIGITWEVLARFGVRIDKDVHARPRERVDRYFVNGGQSYRPGRFRVDGDWSGAAFLLVAGAIAGSVEVRRLGFGQPDSAIMDALSDAGADAETVDCDNARVQGGPLKAFEFDASDCPDLFPPLAVLACNCEGKSVIRGARRLAHKESDRAAVLARELGRLGADIKVVGDRMEIAGRKLAGGRVNPHGDHRIAMAAAIAALNSEKGVEIEDEGCVSKSYPRFFEDLEKVVEK